jgi:hypothetical protein
VNAITIAKEAFYSWNTASAQTLALDKIFKENNVSFTGTGAQDILWGYLPASISGCSHKIGKIKGLILWESLV